MIDFQRLAAKLLARSETLVPAWLPGGRLRGREWVCGNLQGEKGDSCSVNVDTGRWADFAGDAKGGDLVSLYAAIYGMTQADAAKSLDDSGEFRTDRPMPVRPDPPRKPVLLDAPALRPPEGATFLGEHSRWGVPSAIYAYRDEVGLLGYVCRYEAPEGKQFSPWRWTSSGWTAKALPKPRTLYGLERLQAAPAAQVLIVEGEKAVEAAREILKPMVVICWSGGSNAVDHTDWTPLTGRIVDLWPDNDEPGRKAMAALGAKLMRMGATVRIINPAGQPEKWDVADAVVGGWGKKEIIEFITRENRKYLVTLSEPAPEGANSEAPKPAALEPSAAPARVTSPPPSVADLTLPPDLRDLHPHAMWSAFGLDTGSNNGVPTANEDTVDRILRHYPGVFWYDDFLQRPMTTLGEGTPRPLQDADFGTVTIFMQRQLRIPKMAKRTVTSGIEAYLPTQRRNVARDYMKSLQWDGVKRLHNLLPIGFGTRDDEYYRKVGRNFVMQMVHRVLVPGCQADYMPIFESGQGQKKSTALRIIGKDWFAEAHEMITSKDFLQLLPGKMLLEISELASFSRGEIERIKGIITNRVDTYRPSYGRLSGDYPRMCVFAGTTNRDDWNKDTTGARRFWRVVCGKLSIDWIADNREQFTAEAVAYVRQGEEHFQVPEELARALQDEARELDAWHDPIMSYVAAHNEVRAEDVLMFGLNVPVERHDKKAMTSVRETLRSAGWVSSVSRVNGRPQRVWRRPSIADERFVKPMDEEGELPL